MKPRKQADKALSETKRTTSRNGRETPEERDPEQAWFWTEEWQAGERRVDEHLKRGEVEDFDSMEEFLDSLDE